MSVLVVPTPIGLGTCEAESLLSLLQRTADCYQVSLRRVVRLVMNASEYRRIHHSTCSNLKGFLSQRSTVLRLTSGLALLSGKKDGESTALLRMTNAVAHGQGLIGEKIRHCPDCLDPGVEICYGMLAHQMRFVFHCPKHGSVLNECCLACGHQFSLSRSIIGSRVCTACNAQLWTQRREEPALTPFQAWCEKQLLQFVIYATDVDEQQPDESWADMYARGLVRLSSAERGTYSYSEVVFIRATAKRNAEYPDNRPTMSTLLRLASIQAVDLVSFIKAPLESCSPRLLNIGGAKDRGRGRHNHSQESWLKVKEVVERLLATNQDVLLSSKKSLLRSTGLTPAGFWQHFPELSVQYELERGRRDKLAREIQYRRAFEAAERLVKQKMYIGEAIQVRRDGAQLMASERLSKAIAERAIHAAMAVYKIAGSMSN